MKTKKETMPATPGRLKYWLPALLWILLIFTLSSISFSDTSGGLFLGLDKLIHFTEFGILSILLTRGLYKTGSGTISRYWLCIFAAVVYGGLDEIHQFFVPGRFMQWSDFVANSIGAFVCTWAWLSIKGEKLIKA